MTKRARFAFLGTVLLAAFALAAAACSWGSAEEDIVETVKKYNEALTRSYAELETHYVEEYVTEEEFKAVSKVLHDLMGKDETMQNSQEVFTVRAVRMLGAEKAEVDTYERWVSWRQDRASGALTRDKQRIEYQLRYTLVKRDGRWVVASVAAGG